MSDITHLSPNPFFIFKSSTLSYLFRFILSQKIVNTIIFWFDLTRSLISVCRELYLPPHIQPLWTLLELKQDATHMSGGIKFEIL